MLQKHNISDTSFLVAESRARRLDISRDDYAKHWVPPEKRSVVANLWEDFSHDVYPHDDLEVAIRNRFFLECVQRFTATNNDIALVNVGAGLTSYPFLLQRGIRCFECDLPHIVKFKKQRMDELSASGILPARDISFIGLDVSRPEGQEKLRTLLVTTLAEHQTFILMEGLSYYLSIPVLDALFAVFRDGQRPGSQVGLDFWMPNMLENRVFRRLQQFFAKRFGFLPHSYCLFDKHWIEAIEGFRIRDLSSAARSERTYASSSVLSEENAILPENYALVERI